MLGLSGLGLKGFRVWGLGFRTVRGVGSHTRPQPLMMNLLLCLQSNPLRLSLKVAVLYNWP